MNDEPLLFGLAAVLAGIATLEFVLAFVYTPALFAIAIPFAAAAYLVWYHASGRLRKRAEEGRAGSYRQRAGGETGGFGAGARDSYSGRRGGFDADGRGRFGGRETAGAQGAQGGRGRGAWERGARADGARGGARVQQNTGPTPREAYRLLGLDPDADFEEVRQAYREKVKSVHPDRDGGDEDEFKRVNEAYEVLQERN